jgi:hypothetical protein
MFIFNVKAKTLCSIIKDLCMHLKCLTMSKEIYTFRGQVNKKREREREKKREKNARFRQVVKYGINTLSS